MISFVTVHDNITQMPGQCIDNKVLSIAGFLWWSNELYIPKRYIDYSSWNAYKVFAITTEWIISFITVIVLAQILHITNFTVGFFKKRLNRH